MPEIPNIDWAGKLSPPPQSPGSGEKLYIETITNKNNLIKHADLMKPLQKTLSDGFLRALSRCWEGGTSGEVWRLHTPVHKHCLMDLFHLAAPECILYNKLVILSKVLF